MEVHLQVLVCSLVLGYVASTYAVNPGLKIKVTQAGLNYAASEAIDVLSRDVQGQTIPDQHGESDVKVGKVEWWLTGIHVTSFGKPSSSVVVNPGAGITWSAHGTSVGLHADWRYKYRLWFIKVRDHGSLDVSVSGVEISLSVHLGMDSTGRPTISATGCSCSISHVDVDIHGGRSWLYNIFNNKIANAIKKNLNSQLCKSAQNAINVNAVKQLAKLKLKVDIKEVELDYSLVSPPFFATGYIETSHKGAFSWKNGSLVENLNAPVPATDLASEKMITVWIGNYVMDSLGFVLQNHDVLMYNLTQDDVHLSAEDKDLLNTSCTNGLCIGTFFYQVKELYPNCQMALNMASTEPPILRVVPDNLVGYIHGLLKYYVQLANGTEVYLFTTDMKVNVTLSAKIINEHKIVAKVDKMVSNITVIDTKITGISNAALNWIFNAISQKFLIPKLNEVGKEGIDIPNADDVHFMNPQLSLTQGAVTVAADFKYQPNPVYFGPRSGGSRMIFL